LGNLRLHNAAIRKNSTTILIFNLQIAKSQNHQITSGRVNERNRALSTTTLKNTDCAHNRYSGEDQEYDTHESQVNTEAGPLQPVHEGIRK